MKLFLSAIQGRVKMSHTVSQPVALRSIDFSPGTRKPLRTQRFKNEQEKISIATKKHRGHKKSYNLIV